MKVAIYNVVVNSLDNAIIAISSGLEHNQQLQAYIFVDYKVYDNIQLYIDKNPKINFIDYTKLTDIRYSVNKLEKYIDFENNHGMFLNLNTYFMDLDFEYTIYTHEDNFHLGAFTDIYHDTIVTAAQMNKARHLKNLTNKFMYFEQVTEKLFYNDQFMVFNLKAIKEHDLFNSLLNFVESYYYLVEEYDSQKVIEQYSFIEVFNQYLGKVHSHTLLLQNYLVETTNQYPYDLAPIVIHQNLFFNYFGAQMIGYEEVKYNFYNIFAQLEYIEIILDYIDENHSIFPHYHVETMQQVRKAIDEMISDRNAKYQEMINA